MRLLLATAALLPVAAAPAAAQQWYRVGGNENTMSYVDLASLKPASDGKITGDVESVYATPLDEGIVAARIRTEFNCTNTSFRTLSYSYYMAGGKFLRTEPSETINEYKLPKPGSINIAIMEFACKRTGGTAVGDPIADAKAQF
ncbi:surface-adhesin E family protein [Sphingomonas sp. KR3-1]|uniref:surface-adhesin E family protein n=1 Tax=Sphingomonas sp. KR3-1 TaxID=3156611 RepID=UPI0032B430AE